MLSVRRAAQLGTVQKLLMTSTCLNDHLRHQKILTLRHKGNALYRLNLTQIPRKLLNTTPWRRYTDGGNNFLSSPGVREKRLHRLPQDRPRYTARRIGHPVAALPPH